MIDSKRLLEHAQILLSAKKGTPFQSDMRRAVSSAYYAMFHHLSRAAADHLVGSSPSNRKRLEYDLAYRSLQYSSMFEACEAVRKTTLSPKYARACGRQSFGAEIRTCATEFVDLQRIRHAADYSPSQRFTKAQVGAFVATARYGMHQLDTCSDAEKRLFLALLVFRVRD